MTVVALEDWQAEIVRLKSEDGSLTSDQIAEQVGKHAGTVRKVLKRAREAGQLPDGPISGASTNGNGSHGHSDVPPEDDPEFEERDPLEDFKAEAGEAVGPMPPPEPEDTEPEVETRVAGTRQMAIDFGDESPIVTKATVKLTSEKRPSGFFGLGDRVSGTFEAIVTGAPGKLRFDKDIGDWVAAPVDYVLTIEEFTVKGEAA